MPSIKPYGAPKLTCYVCGSTVEVAAITTIEEYLVFCPACLRKHNAIKSFLLTQLSSLEAVCHLNGIKPYSKES